MGTGTDLVKIENFAPLAQGADAAARIAEATAFNLEDEEVSIFDLDRVKVPSGGAKSFEVPVLGDVQSAKDLRAIILVTQKVRTYYKAAYDGSKNPPDCVSPDGKCGIGTPGGNCKTCALNEWGSDNRGKGKACQERRHLVILTEQGGPYLMDAPPTSIGALKKYLFDLSNAGRLYHAVFTKIGLIPAKNAGGIDYSEATFCFAGDVPAEYQAAVEGFRSAYLPIVRQRQEDLAKFYAPNGSDEEPEMDPFADEEPSMAAA